MVMLNQWWCSIRTSLTHTMTLQLLVGLWGLDRTLFNHELWSILGLWVMGLWAHCYGIPSLYDIWYYKIYQMNLVCSIYFLTIILNVMIYCDLHWVGNLFIYLFFLQKYFWVIIVTKFLLHTECLFGICLFC